MIKSEIIGATEGIFSRISIACSVIEDAGIFNRPDKKWSIAENIQHLIISTKTANLAFWIPRIILRWIGGTANRKSRTYDEVKEKYYHKLREGATASSRYVPKPIEIQYGKQKLLGNWNKAASNYIAALSTKRTEEDLDSYLVKHPLLGRITLRELCYFTIFHSKHHLQSIQKPVKTQ